MLTRSQQSTLIDMITQRIEDSVKRSEWLQEVEEYYEAANDVEDDDLVLTPEQRYQDFLVYMSVR